MIPIKVYRAHWTFPELQEHFRVTPLDLRRMVLSGALRPAFHMAEVLQPVETEGSSVRECDGRGPVKGWLWAVQESAEQYGNFNCRYVQVRDRPLHEVGAKYWALPEPLTLDQILGLGVVMDGNVRAIEESVKEDPSRELSPREEKTRDRLIATMAAEILQWKPGERVDLTGLSDLVHASQAYGIPFSYNTAKDHVWRAWERAKPKRLD